MQATRQAHVHVGEDEDGDAAQVRVGQQHGDDDVPTRRKMKR